MLSEFIITNSKSQSRREKRRRACSCEFKLHKQGLKSQIEFPLNPELDTSSHTFMHAKYIDKKGRNCKGEERLKKKTYYRSFYLSTLF